MLALPLPEKLSAILYKRGLLLFAGLIIGWYCLPGCTPEQSMYSVGYVTVTGLLTKEDSLAFQWMEDHEMIRPQVVIVPREGGRAERNLDVLWLHISDSTMYTKYSDNQAVREFLRTAYANGRRLLLTNYAAMLPHEAGIESAKPEIRHDTLNSYEFFDKKGIQSFRGHPVFKSLFGGAFIWDAHGRDREYTLPKIGYFESNWPVEGKVVGVEKAYVFVYSDRRLMVEYNSDSGGAMLTVGSFVNFEKENFFRYRLEKLIENSFSYLINNKRSAQAATYWEPSENSPEEFTIKENSEMPTGGNRLLDGRIISGMSAVDDNPQGSFFDVAGRRCLIMGNTLAGIDEVWIHPIRVLRDYEAGLVLGDSVLWLGSSPLSVNIRPESLTRTYRTPVGKLEEVIYSSIDKAGGLVHYNLYTVGPVDLLIRFRCDLRWMWPYDEKALGNVYYAYDNKLGALHVSDISRDFYCLFGGDVYPAQTLAGQYGDIGLRGGQIRGDPTDLNQVYYASVYRLDQDNDHSLNFAFTGTGEGRKKTLKTYCALLQNPAGEYSGIVQHYIDLLDTKLTVETPDTALNALLKWALVGTDRFITHTPPLGTALVAGFATTARGWNGNHSISGRPGYAWYFGRDAAWSAFALDDYGDFESVRKQLDFFQKFQDSSGKIFHELSTSGVVHYDASDATPLYLILAAHYLRASGDIAFIRKSWPHLEKAMEFLCSTDTDGDGLIENTNVGHGWVEGGALWGSHNSIYLTALWAQTLKDAAYMTKQLGKEDLSERYSQDAGKVQQFVSEEFWSNSGQFYNFGRYTDGTFNPERTIMPAIPAYFNLLEDEKAIGNLEELAGNEFTTNWGVRIVSSRSKHFNPRGYHTGSVWPLFTGWTALAEYEYGRPLQGFAHIMNNLQVANHWAQGYVEEVLHGEQYNPSGVCPHQCWSETGGLHPAITGMIGWKPDAPDNSACLQPRFPVHWNRVVVNHLKVGDSDIRMEYERGAGETRYRFRMLDGPPVNIDLKPELPDGMEITRASLNGKEIAVSGKRKRGILAEPITFRLKKEGTIVLEHTGGIGIAPVVEYPQPGDQPLGTRVISSGLEGKHYEVLLEGKGGSSVRIQVYPFGQKIVSVDNARILQALPELIDLQVRFDGNENSVSRKRIGIILE